MKKLHTNFTIQDRIQAEVRLGAECFGPTSKGAGTFILAKNASLKVQDRMEIRGAFSAYTNEPFTVSGEFVTIELPGICFLGTKVYEVLPAVPGDLSYIDGCSNSNLIAPPRNGDPCTNYLYFPPGINQTEHSHPSFRLGIVLSGAGVANLPNEKIDLVPGDIFLLDRFVRHGFSTSDNHMSLMVFHPDSDDGPTDEHNPMKRRTYL